MSNQSNMFGWSGKPGELEEGEVLDEGEVLEELSNDDDYSPGSLVIDHVEQGSTKSSSDLPTPPVESLQATLEFDSHPIFGIITSPPSTTPTNTFTPSAAGNTLSSAADGDPANLHLPPLFPSLSSAPQQRTSVAVPTFPLAEGTSVPPITLAPQAAEATEEDGGQWERIKFVAKIDVPSEGSAIDTLCVYQFICGPEFIDILTRRDSAPIIPIKNVYVKAIPGLKQNVLSARISKLGIRSLVLSEPFVSTVKKLNLGLTGSSHYITVMDFIKICGYFRRSIGSFVGNLDLILSTHAPGEIVRMFNDPENVASRALLSRLSAEAGQRNVGKEEPLSEIGVEARKLSLPNGVVLYLLVKDEIVLFPNPELAKVLPAVNRTAMEHFRNSYGITVTQATKVDMDVMKYLGVVSAKAGRTLLYKVNDVVTMFHHWKSAIPDFIKDIAQGKILGEKITFNPAALSSMGGVLGGSKRSRTPSPHNSSPRHASSTSSPITSSSLLSSQVAPPTNHTPPSSSPARSVSNPSPVPTTAFKNSYESSHNPRKRTWQGGVPGASPTNQRASLTPDKFQVPVQMLNSLAAEGASNSSHMTGHMTQQQQQQVGGAELLSPQEKKRKVKRRTSSVTGSPLDDQDIDYSSVQWGEESLTLLCPKGAGGTMEQEPYIIISELIQKVVHDRACVNVQQRNKLGITVLPASSLQIHALRARGALDSSAGKVRLLSISDAVKVAVNSNIQIPGNIIQMVMALSQVPIEDILNPVAMSNVVPPSGPSAAPMPTMPAAMPPVLTGQQQEAPIMKQEVAGPEGMEQGTSDGLIPVHPDITPAPQDWRLDGAMCQVKWGDHTVVVYCTSNGGQFMGLYQVYDVLFKHYVTRMNFKMRMRKLDIRSNRAPSSVRMKLVELGALPTHCPVCGLITVLETEKLAKSYGIEPPAVFYETFLHGKWAANAKAAAAKAVATKQPKQSKPRSKALPHSSQPRPPPAAAPFHPPPHQPPSPPPTQSSQQQQLPPNLFSYQFDPSDDSTHSSSSFSSQVPRPLAPAGQQYGIVPYLTSSQKQKDSQNSSPNLIMTSLGTKFTSQIHSSEPDTTPLIIRIPREHTPFKVLGNSPIIGGRGGPFQPPLPSGSNGAVMGLNSQASLTPNSSQLYPDSRSKVLQSLAKKISQKSKKLSNSINSFRSTVAGPPPPPPQSTKPCPSCGHNNPQHKKRCGYCSEFVVGWPCASCSTLNYHRAKVCAKCGQPVPPSISASFDHHKPHKQPTQQQLQQLQHDQPQMLSHDKAVSRDQRSSEVPGSGGSESSSHPTSPISPKFSAPPIRSAVLKSLFPQQAQSSAAAKGPAGAKAGGSGQPAAAAAKTAFPGASRKCQECGHLNTRMAKKCVQCRSHLQGRACPRCGRPNLNHVTECYKCGATLPPSSTSKWVYVGSHSGRAYKTGSEPTVETIETKVLLTRAPVSCIRCNRIRASGYFKCGRCGDVYKTRPLVDPLGNRIGHTHNSGPPSKKRRVSADDKKSDKTAEKQTIDGGVLEKLGRNLVSLGIQAHMVPLLQAAQAESKEKITAAQLDMESAEAEYQVALSSKILAEAKFLDAKAELDSLLTQVELTTKGLEAVVKREDEAKSKIETLPAQIQEVKGRIEATENLLSLSVAKED